MEIKNPAEMHEKILQSALVVFSRKGYAVATIKEISTLAGCNSITIFRHFEDKEKLFYSVVERFHNIEIDEDAINARLSYANIAADICLLADAFFEIIFEHHNILRIFVNDGAYFEKIRKYVWFIPEPLKLCFMNYLTRLYGGAVGPADAALISEMFLTLIVRTCLRCGVHEGMWELNDEMWAYYRDAVSGNIDFIISVIQTKRKAG